LPRLGRHFAVLFFILTKEVAHRSLVVITIFLIAADATYVLIISARITGDARSWLPFQH